LYSCQTIVLKKNILEYADFLRSDASRKTSKESKSHLEQFFSSMALARLMAAMFDWNRRSFNILDPGAGIGTLFAACVDEVMKLKSSISTISVTAYEIDLSLSNYIKEVFKYCKDVCRDQGMIFEGNLIQTDFVRDSVDKLGIFSSSVPRYDFIILNPPYKKLIHLLKSIEF
jgi:adenine-specific DNA-methyltransferase